MSIRIMTRVWEVELPAIEKLVLLALADFANDEGEAWPSIATLKKKTGASERTIQRALVAIVRAKHVTRKQVPGHGCRYLVNPRQNDTPVRVTPPSESHPTPVRVTPHPRQNDTPVRVTPPSESHPTPVRVTPHPRQSDTQTVNEPSITVNSSVDAGADERANNSAPDPVQPEPVNDDTPDVPPAKPVRRKRAPKALPSIDLPDWVPAEPWKAFVDMRVGKGATPTEHAMHLLVGKLEKFRAQGHSPGDVLNQSTLNNWTDLYPLKDKTDDRGKTNRGSSPGSYRQHDNRDGLQRHLDRKLGVDGFEHSGEPSGKAGRYDAGESEDDSAGRVARVIPLR